MPTILPPLLAGLDLTALYWAAFWALVFSASRLPSRRRWQLKAGETPTPWWVVGTETILGGLVGGIVFALAIPERFPTTRSPGILALLAVIGAALGPYLAAWIPAIARQLIAFFSEKKLGFRIEVKTKEGDDVHESKG